MKKVAKQLPMLSNDFSGDARLYMLTPPMDEANYVVVWSFDPEVYFFAADVNGEVLDWLPLDGSFRGGEDHQVALELAGYEVSE